MTKIASLFVLLLFASLSAASADVYSVNVHVTSVHWSMQPGSFSTEPTLQVDAVIDGKKCLLLSPGDPVSDKLPPALLALGDYKARVKVEKQKTAYETAVTYEFLFPDQKTRTFVVIGISE
jgi:hypothetical protein